MSPLLKPLVLLAALSATALAEDLRTMLADAERAYVRGDLAAAKEKFGLILRAEPGNRTADFYMRRIVADERSHLAKIPPGAATQAALSRVIMQKVDLKDASLVEALEFLRQKGIQASDGRIGINFVQQLDDAAKNAKVTITLNNAPFTEILRYVGELANVQFVYEPYAIVVKPKGATPAASPASNTAEPGVKIQGL